MLKTLNYKRIRLCPPVQCVSQCSQLGEKAFGGLEGRLSDLTGVAMHGVKLVKEKQTHGVTRHDIPQSCATDAYFQMVD